MKFPKPAKRRKPNAASHPSSSAVCVRLSAKRSISGGVSLFGIVIVASAAFVGDLYRWSWQRWST